VNLVPYQQEATEALEDTTGDVLLVAPPGSGMRNALAPLLSGWAQDTLVLVLTDRLVRGHQWRHRLESHEIVPTMLQGSEDALAAIEQGQGPGLTIATVQRVRAGVGRKFLESVRPGVVLLDVATGAGEVGQRQLTQLRSRSGRLIILSATVEPLHWFSPAAVIRVLLTAVLHQRGGSLALRVDTYSMPAETSLLLERCRTALREAGVRAPVLGVQDLHAKILNLLTERDFDDVAPTDDADEHEDVTPVDEAQAPGLWQLVDALEETTEDPRLECLVATVRDVVGQGQLCLVVARQPLEAEYLAGALASANLSSAAVSSMTDPSSRHEFTRSPGTETVLVVTQRVLQDVAATSPPHLVLWSSARTTPSILDTLVWVAVRGGELILLSAEEPSADELTLRQAVQEIAGLVSEGDYPL
jgi:hypothetical protein